MAASGPYTLREGLRFHGGEKVRGRDCVASIKRWAVRDPMGQALLTRVAEMAAPDDRRFTIRLTRPFSQVLNCLAKIGPPTLVVMPERLAMTDSFQSIKEVIGSGPFGFVPGERMVGNQVVYERNQDCVPRPEGMPDWLAGPKIVNFDRVEWHVMPDPGTAAAALENGEADWWENPPNDLLPALERKRRVQIEENSRLGTLGTGVFNHLHAPFNKAAVRRVLLEATLRKALRDAGYQGEKIVMMAASDQAVQNAQAAVALDVLRQLGMDVDYQVMDWRLSIARPASVPRPPRDSFR